MTEPIFTTPTAPEGETAAAVQPATGRPIARIGLLGAAAAALVAVVILAAGSGANPGGTLAAGTDGSGSTTLDSAFDNRGPGGPGDHMGGPGRMGGITITAISGSNISLKTDDGWTRTITVDSGTTYESNGATIALSDLEVGQEIRFQQTRETDGTWTIDAIAVIPPHAGGTVTAVSGSSITVDRRDGTSVTISVTSSTTYDVNGTTGSLSDVTTGMVLMAVGTDDASGNLTATEVHAFTPGQFGPGMRGDHHGPDFDGDGAAPDATSAPATGTGAG